MFLNAGAADSLKKNRSQKLTTGYKEQKSADCFNQMNWERERNEHSMWGKLWTSRARSRPAIRSHGQNNVRIILWTNEKSIWKPYRSDLGVPFYMFLAFNGIHCSQSIDSNAKIHAGTFKFHVPEEEGMERRYGYGSYPSKRYGLRTWLLAEANMKSQPLTLYRNISFTQPLHKMKAYDHILQPQDCPGILLKIIIYVLPRKT